MDYTKIVPVDLDSPCQELSVRGLGYGVVLLVCLFFCISTGGEIYLY